MSSGGGLALAPRPRHHPPCEDFASSSAADAVIFTQDQGQEIQELAEAVVTFFHANDHRISEGEEVSTDEGWLATMPSTHWSSVEAKAPELFDAFTTSLKYGEPLQDHGPSLPERGPVLVKPEEVHQLFFSRTSHPRYLVPARDRPVSRAAE